jgi:MFS family permease
VLGGVATAALATSGAVLLGAFIVRERRARSPLLDLSLFRTAAFTARLASATASYVVLFGAMLAAPVLLERGLHTSVVEAGATLAAMPVAIGVVAPIAGRAYEFWGARRLTSAGMALCAITLLCAARFHGSAGAIACELAGLGVGLGLFTPANSASIMSSAQRSGAGEASGLLNMARGLGTSIGLAVTALVLSLSTAPGRGFVDTMVVLAVVAAMTGLVSATAPRRASSYDGPSLRTADARRGS